MRFIHYPALFDLHPTPYQCWCGMSGIEYGRHGQGNCDYPCSGDASVECGGNNSFTLYDLDSGVQTPAPNPSDDYVGCFMDTAYDRVLSYETTTNSMTPQVKRHKNKTTPRHNFTTEGKGRMHLHRGGVMSCCRHTAVAMIPSIFQGEIGIPVNAQLYPCSATRC